MTKYNDVAMMYLNNSIDTSGKDLVISIFHKTLIMYIDDILNDNAVINLEKYSIILNLLYAVEVIHFNESNFLDHHIISKALNKLLPEYKDCLLYYYKYRREPSSLSGLYQCINAILLHEIKQSGFTLDEVYKKVCSYYENE